MEPHRHGKRTLWRTSFSSTLHCGCTHASTILAVSSKRSEMRRNAQTIDHRAARLHAGEGVESTPRPARRSLSSCPAWGAERFSKDRHEDPSKGRRDAEKVSCRCGRTTMRSSRRRRASHSRWRASTYRPFALRCDWLRLSLRRRRAQATDPRSKLRRQALIFRATPRVMRHSAVLALLLALAVLAAAQHAPEGTKTNSPSRFCSIGKPSCGAGEFCEQVDGLCGGHGTCLSLPSP